MRILEPLARFSGPSPTIFDAGLSALIKCCRPLCQLTRSKNPRMIRGDAHEGRQGRGQPPWRQIVLSERKPGEAHAEHSQSNSNITKADVNRLMAGNAQLASLLTLRVFFGGRHYLECSRRIQREEGCLSRPEAILGIPSCPCLFISCNKPVPPKASATADAASSCRPYPSCCNRQGPQTDWPAAILPEYFGVLRHHSCPATSQENAASDRPRRNWRRR